jgi:hypothetical protein
MSAQTPLAASIAAARITIDPKLWAEGQARAAMRGVQLLRTDPADGPVRMFLLASDGALKLVRCRDDLEGVIG